MKKQKLTLKEEISQMKGMMKKLMNENYDESWDMDSIRRIPDEDEGNYNDNVDYREIDNPNDMVIGVDYYGNDIDLEYDPSSDKHTLYKNGDKVNFDFYKKDDEIDYDGTIDWKNIVDVEDPKTGEIVKVVMWKDRTPQRGIGDMKNW